MSSNLHVGDCVSTPELIKSTTAEVRNIPNCLLGWYHHYLNLIVLAGVTRNQGVTVRKKERSLTKTHEHFMTAKEFVIIKGSLAERLEKTRTKKVARWNESLAKLLERPVTSSMRSHERLFALRFSQRIATKLFRRLTPLSSRVAGSVFPVRVQLLSLSPSGVPSGLAPRWVYLRSHSCFTLGNVTSHYEY